MRAFRYVQAAIVALLVILAGPAAAEKRVALVIGNASYAHATVSKIPANDARLVAKTLSEIGFTEVLEHIDLDMRAFTAALEKFTALCKNADWALMYYAGHAVEVGGTSYLLPTDAKLASAADLAHEAISLGRVLGQFRPQQLMLLILDSPRTNPFRAGGHLSPYKGHHHPEGDVFIAYATQPGNGLTASSGDNGPFALSLVRHMTVRGLDVQQVFDQVRNDVIKATHSKQVPWTHATLTGRRYEFVQSR